LNWHRNCYYVFVYVTNTLYEYDYSNTYTNEQFRFSPSDTIYDNEFEIKMDERTLKHKMIAMGLSLTDEKTIEHRSIVLEKALRIAIPPRDQSDRTSFRRISEWIRTECELGHFDPNIIYRRVIDFAIEASGPGSRNPAAVFTSILKKELGYKK